MVAQGNLWKRKGWVAMDKMRSKLEDLKELRDLVRSLGRGGGWGPLRRAPIQYLDMKVLTKHHLRGRCLICAVNALCGRRS